MKYTTDVEYKDDRGDIVILRKYFDSTDPEIITRCFGKGMIVLNTPMGKMPHEFEVDLHIDNIEDAFEQFETIMKEKAPVEAQKAGKRVMSQMRDQMQQQSKSIITPDQIKPSSTFNPNIRG